MSNIKNLSTWDYQIYPRAPKGGVIKRYSEFNQMMAIMTENRDRLQPSVRAAKCNHNYQEVEYIGEDPNLKDEVSIICVSCNASYCCMECFPTEENHESGKKCPHPIKPALVKRKEIATCQSMLGLKSVKHEAPGLSNWDFSHQQFERYKLGKPANNPEIKSLSTKRDDVNEFHQKVVKYLVDNGVDTEKELFANRVATQKLNLNQPILVTITWIESSENFFIAPAPSQSYDHELAKMKAKFASPQLTKNMVENPQVNHDYLTFVYNDADWTMEWFRGRIVEILPESISLRHVDIGMMATVQREDIRVIPEECYQPALVINVGLLRGAVDESKRAGELELKINHCYSFIPLDLDEDNERYYGTLDKAENDNISTFD